MSVEKCPVCEGSGNVRLGFYDDNTPSDGRKVETCRACNGSGIFVDGKPVLPKQ